MNALASCALALATAFAAASCPAADVSPARPQIPSRTFNLRDFGAAGDGRTSDTPAFEKAIGAVDRAGGGTLTVPAGTYFTGPFDLCSSIDLHLEKGATLLFSQKFDDYRLSSKKYRPMIGGSGLHDVAISGEGVIDGQGQPWWVLERKAKTDARRRGLPDAEIGRPRMIQLTSCERLLFSGITLQNSPMFHLVPSKSTDVTVYGISIKSPADSPNTDGIDPSACKRVLIEHCRVDTGDDCVAVKGGSGPDEDILVTDCTFLHGHGCSIGSDTLAGVRNMTVRRCTFDGTSAGVRLKSRRGRGGMVENVTYSDLQMRNVGQAIVISSFYYGLPRPGEHVDAEAAGPETPAWRNITIKNIVAKSGTRDAGLIIGLPEMPARGILLENVTIDAPIGLRIAYADGVTLRNVKVNADSGRGLLVEDTVSNLVH
ncbi:MAG TPA: glycoside hydrolase family 28 protein [Opitutaceae bacterium]